MIDNILQILRNSQNPGMQLASTPQPYQDDLGVNPMDLNQMMSQLNGGEEVSFGDPKTLSGRIQEWLGAKPPTQGGMDQQILAQRFQPNSEDAVNAISQTWANPTQATTAQHFADERMNLAQKMQVAQMRNGGSGSVFAQTMEAINNDPGLANLPMMDKIRLAQNKLGTNLTIGANGQVSDMSGAAQGLGNLAYGEKRGAELGQKQVDLEYNPQITGQEANARNQSEASYAQQIAGNKALGATQGEVQSKLPVVEQNTAYAQKLLGDLVTHPGLPYGTGVMSMSPTVPGTAQADFRARLNQINGTAFLQAFSALRGGGQISNVEGDKATQAITRMTTPGVSKKDFIAAANDLNNILEIGLKRARGEAGGNFNQSFSPNDFNQQTLGGSASNAIDEELRRRGVQ